MKPACRTKPLQQHCCGAGEGIKPRLKHPLQGIPHREGEEEDQAHNQQEHRNPPEGMGQNTVYFICRGRLFTFIKKSLSHYLFYIAVFTLDDFLFIASVYNADLGDGVLPFHLFIILQKLDGMPAHGGMAGIMSLHPDSQRGYFLFYLSGVIQHIFLHSLLAVMNKGVEQNIQSCAFRRRHRHHGDIPKHLRKSVHVDLHAPLLHHIDHVQSENHGLSQLQKL